MLIRLLISRKIVEVVVCMFEGIMCWNVERIGLSYVRDRVVGIIMIKKISINEFDIMLRMRNGVIVRKVNVGM